MELFVISLSLLICIVWVILTYNNLQEKKQSIIEQSSNIQVSLQKRRDLAARIIDIAKGFDEHEKLTHLNISAATHDASTSTLSELCQNFPELKANETYSKLMEQLEELEHYISQKREAYNATVRHYNSYRGRFPAMLVANKFNFECAPYYDVEDEQSLQKLASFNRDDAQAVKNLVANSKANIKNSAQKLKTLTSEQLAEVKNSEAFKSVVQQGEETTSKVVEAAKNKIKEKQKAEKDKDLHEV